MDDGARDAATLGFDAAQAIDDVCNRFEAAWKGASKNSGQPRLEDHLAACPPAEQPALLRELIAIDIFHRRRLGETLRAEDYLSRFPALDVSWLAKALSTGAPVAGLADFVATLRVHRLLPPARLDEVSSWQGHFADSRGLAGELICRGWLTPFQANQLLQGRGQMLVLGPYVLLERLGEGGMGTVYKARHGKLDRTVALKVIRKDRITGEEAVKRFHREIQAAAKLAHPNIVHAFDADIADGTLYFAMEYVEGGDLARLVRERGPLPVAEACDYIRQAALGLQHAHERGLVHRDIKPSNLLVTFSREPAASAGGIASTHATKLALAAGSRLNVVKILDLGLARVAARAEDASTAKLTSTGMVMGTPDYIAPEQAVEAHEADSRADLYSLGCTLYHLLTGRVPFPTGTFIQKINKHQFAEPDRVEELRPEVPPAVAAVVRKLMAKRPEDRYQTPAEAAAALAHAQGVGVPALAGAVRLKAGLQPAAPVATTPSPFADLGTERKKVAAASARASGSPRTLLTVVAGLGVLGLAIVAWRLLSGSGSSPDPDVPEGPPRVRPAPILPGPRTASSREEALAALRKLGARIVIDEKQSSQPVTGIDLAGKKHTDADLLYVAAFPEIIDLDLSDNAQISDAGLAHLKPLTRLRDLRLRGTVVTNAGVKPLLDNRGLQVLILGNAKVTDALMPDIGQLSEMVRLEISGTQVTDAGLERLRPLTKLTSLQIGPHITDAGLEHIGHHTKLLALQISGKSVTGKGVARLAKLTELTNLYLGGPITDEGLEVFQHMSRLQYLNLIGTKINGSCLQHLRCQNTLQHLHLDGTDVNDDALMHLKGMAHLHSVGLAATKVTDAGLEHLRALPSLQTLGLNSTAVSDAGLKRLAELKTLAHLYLPSTKVTDAGMEYVATMKGLKSLRVSETKVGDPGLALLEGLPALTALEVRGSRVTAKGVDRFRAARPAVWLDRAPTKK